MDDQFKPQNHFDYKYKPLISRVPLEQNSGGKYGVRNFGVPWVRNKAERCCILPTARLMYLTTNI
jgi:hypothetical protein